MKRKMYARLQLLMDDINEYACAATIHGVHYILQHDYTILERLIWFLIFSTLLVSNGALILDFWTEYTKYPTNTIITDMFYDLGKVTFPSISICPINKIDIVKAYQIIRELVPELDYEDSRVEDFLIALTFLQHPLYLQMTPFLKQSSSILGSLDRINLTTFMLNVMPTCDDVLHECRWKGRLKKCCDMFKLQRSEEGFCYSFNSGTSELRHKCAFQDLLNEGSECTLLKNRLHGPGTALHVRVRIPYQCRRIPRCEQVFGKAVVKVQIHDVTEFPEGGMGFDLPLNAFNTLRLSMRPELISSSEDLKTVTPDVRHCYFRSEKNGILSSSYSLKTCLIECRLRYISKVCHCLPYYFNYLEGENVPTCTSSQLICLVNHSEELRFFRPPNITGSGFNIEDFHFPLSCEHCLPTCNENRYDLLKEYGFNSNLENEGDTASLEIHYRSPGIKYSRNTTFDGYALLVSLGGVAGLFLGGSVLSVFEIFYWTIRAIFLFIFPSMRRNRKFNKVRAAPFAWIN